MYQVSSLSITCISISLIFCLFVPIIACTILKKKKGASLRSFLIGAITFIFFALILEQIMHTIVLTAWQEYFEDPKNLLVKAAYGGLAAASFEEIGRFVAMKCFMKKNLNQKETLMYGVGHGGIEAIIIGGLSGISNLATAISLNAGALDETIASGDQAVITVIQQMVDLPSWQFLLAGVERMSALTLQICLSYLIYMAVKKGSFAYFYTAMLIHFLVDAGTVLLAEKVPIYWIELILIVICVALAYKIAQLYREEMEENL